MNATHLKLVVAIVSLALIGLIGIQIYWILNEFSLERDKIEHSAGEALNEVVELLERHETLTKLRSHQEARYLFIQEDETDGELQFPPDDSLVEYVVSKKIERKDGQIELQLIEEGAGHKSEKTITHSVENLPFTSDLEEEVKLRVAQADSIELEMSTPSDPLAPVESAIREKVQTKKAFLGDIVKSLIEVDLNQPIDERIDPKIVDSLLHMALTKHGLQMPFEMGVFDGKRNLIFGDDDRIVQLQESNLRVQLFPNDVIQLPYFIQIYFPNLDGYIFKNIWVLLSISLLLVLALVGIFYYIIRTIVLQKQNSEIKNDFINNMTHELKTPISTISLACEALGDPELSKIENVKNRYIGIINAENKRLGLLVEEVLQSAVLDKGSFKLKREEINLHDLVGDVIDKFSIQVKEKNGTLNAALNANESLVEADKNHLTNVIYNLLDNAVKYSRDNPAMEIATENHDGYIVLSVKDSGIGIGTENLRKVFDRLYRVPTGNVHNVKGFGLGLSYVKIITERHGGRVYVESTLGKGSTFYIELPLKEEVHGSRSKAA